MDSQTPTPPPSTSVPHPFPTLAAATHLAQSLAPSLASNVAQRPTFSIAPNLGSIPPTLGTMAPITGPSIAPKPTPVPAFTFALIPTPMVSTATGLSTGIPTPIQLPTGLQPTALHPSLQMQQAIVPPIPTSTTPPSPKEKAVRPYGISRRLESQSRNVVLNVYKFFRNQNRTMLQEDVEARTAEATNVSLRLVQRIRHEAKKSRDGVIVSPVRKKRFCHVTGHLSESDKEHITMEIQAFNERGELPTLDTLLEKLREPPVSFRGSRTTLWKVVKELGFSHQKRGTIGEHKGQWVIVEGTGGTSQDEPPESESGMGEDDTGDEDMLEDKVVVKEEEEEEEEDEFPPLEPTTYIDVATVQVKEERGDLDNPEDVDGCSPSTSSNAVEATDGGAAPFVGVDEFHQFGMMVAAQLRAMPLKQALETQLEIQKLLTVSRIGYME